MHASVIRALDFNINRAPRLWGDAASWVGEGFEEVVWHGEFDTALSQVNFGYSLKRTPPQTLRDVCAGMIRERTRKFRSDIRGLRKKSHYDERVQRACVCVRVCAVNVLHGNFIRIIRCTL